MRQHPLKKLKKVNNTLVTRWGLLLEECTSSNPRLNQDDLDLLLAIISRDDETQVVMDEDITPEYYAVLNLQCGNVSLMTWFLKGGYQYVQEKFPGVNDKFRQAINLYRDQIADWDQIPGISDEDIESGQVGLWFLENSQNIDFLFDLLIRRWSHAPDIIRLFTLIKEECPQNRIIEILGLEYKGSTLAHWFLTTDYAELAQSDPGVASKLEDAIYKSVTDLDDPLGCKKQFESWKTNILRALVTQSPRDEASLLKHQWDVLKSHSKVMVKELLLYLESNPTLARNWWDRLTQSLSKQDHKVVLNADLLDTLYYALDIPGRGVTLEEVSKIYLDGGNCDEKFGATGEKRCRSLSTIVNLCKSEEDIGVLSDFLKSPNIDGQYAESGANYDRVINARTQLEYMITQVKDIITGRLGVIELARTVKEAYSELEALQIIGCAMYARGYRMHAPLIEDAFLYCVFTKSPSFKDLEFSLSRKSPVYDRQTMSEKPQFMYETYYRNQGDVRKICDEILDTLLIGEITACRDAMGCFMLLDSIARWYQPSASFMEYMHEKFPPEDNKGLYMIDLGYGQNRRPLREWSKSESSPQCDAKPIFGFVVALFNSLQDMFSKIAQWFKSKFEFKKTGQNYQPSGGLSSGRNHNPVFTGRNAHTNSAGLTNGL